jgi:hypothetical protein
MEEFVQPVVKAIAGSGILGKEVYYAIFPEEDPGKEQARENEAKKLTAGQEEVPSFNDWLGWAEEVAYGLLHLLPAQFYAMTPLELDRMAECRAKA